MENSQTLATDSFSYSWLINRKPSIDNINGLVESHRPSLDDDGSAVLEGTVREEVMHAVVLQQYYSSCPNNNFFLKKEAEEEKEEEDFDFKIGGADHLIPADEIFSGGCIKPVPVYHDANTSSSSTRVQLVSSSSSSTPISSSSSFPPSPPRNITTTNRRSGRRRNEYYLILMMRKWSKSSLHKCFAFLRRIKFGWCSRKSVRVVDFLDRNVCEVGIISSSSSSWSDSLLVLHRVPSPPVTPFSPAGRRSCDVETSIHEAILHCKRSFGQ